jgi:hypothetical protein
VLRVHGRVCGSLTQWTHGNAMNISCVLERQLAAEVVMTKATPGSLLRVTLCESVQDTDV